MKKQSDLSQLMGQPGGVGFRAAALFYGAAAARTADHAQRK